MKARRKQIQLSLHSTDKGESSETRLEATCTDEEGLSDDTTRVSDDSSVIYPVAFSFIGIGNA